MSGIPARINRIYIENVKSYKRETIDFHDGVTVISGKNGAGKSTIFESIGYCLFGVPANRFIANAGNMIRHGRSSAVIRVEYTGSDGIEYRITRKNTGSRIIEEMSLDGWYPRNPQAPEEFIRNSLGLQQGISLPDQFTNIIGPFQSEFTTPFLLSDEKRQEYFNRILGIDQWKNLFKKTGNWNRIFENRISLKEKDLEHREELIADLPRLIEDMKALEKQLKENAGELEKAEALEKSESGINSFLKSQRERIEHLRIAETEATGKKSGVSRMMKSTEEELKKALSARTIIDENRAGYEEYVKNHAMLEELDGQRKDRDALQKKIVGLEKKTVSMSAGLSSEIKGLDSKKAENITIRNNLERELKERNGELEKQNGLVKSGKKELDKIRTALESVSPELLQPLDLALSTIVSSTDSLNTIENEVSGYRVTLAQLPELEKAVEKIPSLSRLVEELSGEKISVEKEIADSGKGRAMLSQGMCPFFGDQCLNLEGKDSTAFFNARIERATARLNEITARLESVRGELDVHNQDKMTLGELSSLRKVMEKRLKDREREEEKLKGAITADEVQTLFYSLKRALSGFSGGEIKTGLSALEKLISGFAFPDDVSEYADYFRVFHDGFEKLRQDVLAGLKREADRIEGEYQKLARQESALENGISVLSKRMAETLDILINIEKEEKRLAVESGKLKKMESELDGLKAETVGYSGLDERIDQLNRINRERKGCFDLYTLHIKTSENAPGIEKEIKKLREEENRLTAEISGITQELVRLSGEFNPGKLAESDRRLMEIAGNISRLRSEISFLTGERRKISGEMEKKKKIREEIQTTKKEISELKKSQSFAEFLRGIFKQVAPRVSRVLRERITVNADAIYRCISGTGEELSWFHPDSEKDMANPYSILLIDMADGRQRIRFDQQLSGGQLMSAVISLRLALLQLVKSPMAFFDEPTSNLDVERRQNLANALKMLNNSDRKWYRQLFLVSHDESFQGISGNTIELETGEDSCTRIVRF